MYRKESYSFYKKNKILQFKTETMQIDEVKKWKGQNTFEMNILLY